MPSAVINVLHIMLGCDIHQELTPPGAPPIPVPVPIPHIATAPLGNVPGMLAGTVKCTLGNPTNDGIAGKLVFVNFVKMPIVIQGSDIGPVIPHIPLGPCNPLPLLPLIIIGSGSTSEFFAFSVKANNKPVAIATVVIIGANLNCAFPCAMPSYVFAPSLVFTGTRIGDFIAGLAGMAMDVALSAILNAVFNGIGMKGDGGLFGKSGLMAKRLCPTILKKILNSGVAQSPFFQPLLGAFAGVGSPIGYSNSKTTAIGHYYGDAKTSVATGIANYFNPPPNSSI